MVADWSRDLVRELLSVDLAAREGTATVQLAEGAAPSTSFSTEGLEIREVTDLAGAAVEWMEEDGILTPRPRAAVAGPSPASAFWR